jgi:hypothetical protein
MTFQIMNNRFKHGAALLAAAGTFAFAGAAPANAAACPDSSAALSTLTPLAFSCNQGGFIFNLTSWSGFVGADAISFSNPTATDFTYSLQANSPWLSGPKTLNYTLTAPSGKVIQFYTSSLSSSRPNNKAGKFNVDGSVGNALATLVNNTATGAQYDYTSSLPTSETFTDTLYDITGNGIQTVQASFGVVDAPTPPPAPVPGPLPIFGAAAAFGFSRKVRNRIKAAA